jgi:uncharacterized protein YprB with RNaseH-like and TPR domain
MLGDGMVSLSKKLAKLRAQTIDSSSERQNAAQSDGELAHSIAPVAPTPPQARATVSPLGDRAQRLEQLRERLRSLAERPKSNASPRQVSRSVALSPQDRERAMQALPFVRGENSEGSTDVRAKSYDSTQRHGHVSLDSAKGAHGAAIATLALDLGLADFAAEKAVFLDTETTGLSGGTGMMAFLVGCGKFEHGRFVVEQWFVREPCEEAAMLTALRERVEQASALVTFNGKSFDWPLLRARYVMNRLVAPVPPPHLDLLHVARRVYGRRTTQCKLTTLEREVLGFVREGDVDGAEIPAIYSRYLRHGGTDELHAVIEHNLWDVIAMAALVGELAARVKGEHSAGRFEASDMAGLAHTALRAGESGLALRLAGSALEAGTHDADVLSRASEISAKIHRKKRSYREVHAAWQQVLLHSPDDAQAHLELAKLYEHHYSDPYRALTHARAATGAEKPAALARRVARLQDRVRYATLRLPGID